MAASSLYIIPPTHAAAISWISAVTDAITYVAVVISPMSSQSMWKRKPQSQTTRAA